MTNLQIFILIAILIILFYYAIIIILQIQNKNKSKKENFTNLDGTQLTCPGVEKMQTNAIADPAKYSENLDCIINKLNGELNIDSNITIYTDILNKQEKLIKLLTLQTLLNTDLNTNFSPLLANFEFISKLPSDSIAFMQGYSNSNSSSGNWF